MQEVLALFTIEAFLDRLRRSTDHDRLILKGGALLAAYGGRRPTRDIDFQAVDLRLDDDTVAAHILDITSVDSGDDIVFDGDSVKASPIRNDDPYAGIRVSMPVLIAKARVELRVDIGVADPIIPPPRFVELPRLLGGTLSVLAYPLIMVLAEKIVTAITRGSANTRWRDFWDVVVLSHTHTIDSDALHESIRRVAEFRHVSLMPLTEVLDGFASIGQSGWASWRRRNQLMNSTPHEFAAILTEFITFADPIVRDEIRLSIWDPQIRRWISVIGYQTN